MRYYPSRDDAPETGGFVPDSQFEQEDEFIGGFVSEETPFDAETLFSEPAAAENHAQTIAHRERRRARSGRKRRRLIALLAALILLLAAELGFLYGRWARPPEVNNRMGGQSEGDELIGHSAGRKDGCYTFLIAGKDKAAGLTDTVLVGMLDANNHTLHFYSIPRDTAVNISWSPKKINQYYPAAENQGRNGAEALIDGVENLIGYRVDCFAIFDVDVFVELVDTMGGVWFDVPVNMDYDDPGQDLYIHVAQGYQKLNGYDTMCVFRYRSTYINGDIGRLDVQHDLLKSIASQMLSLGNIPNIRKLVEIYEKNVITNLTGGNVMFFVQEFLKMKEDDIVFETVPAHYDGEVNGMSYVFIYPDEWLADVNAHLNPFTAEITAGDVDIIYETPGGGRAATSGSIRGDDRW